jgi:hypothetical protein
MRTWILSLPLAMFTVITVYPQETSAQDRSPSNEEFVNAVCRTVVDSSFTTYYLIQQSDTCRFVKFNYEDWAQSTLKEPVSIVILNELAEKVYLSKGRYFWRKEQLKNAICISNKQADSVLYYKKGTVFSFSQPQFTEDGQYAVIDLNFVCGTACGEGFTCVFRLTHTGWKLIAKYTNWSA